MTVFAIILPLRGLQRQLTEAQLRRLDQIAGTGSWFHVENPASLAKHPLAKDVEAVITGWGTPLIGLDILTVCPRLKLIAHSAGTVRGILDPALLDRGVRVTNCAAANAVPVAEFLVSWILRWNKMLPYWEAAYKGRTDIYTHRDGPRFRDIGNRDKTVGIIGASKVGRYLIELLKPFDLDVVLYDPYVSAAEVQALGATKADLNTLLSRSDIVSINAPLLPETQNMIAIAELAKMKDGALLINTARGKLVNHDDLLEVLQSGRIHAVLDVTDPEPLPAGSPFFELDNVYLTPHVAGSMGREIQRMTDSLLGEIELFLSEGLLQFEVNQENWATAA